MINFFFLWITKLGMCKTNYFGMCEDKIIKQLRYLMGVLLPSTNQLLKTEKCKMSHCIFAWYLRKGVELLKHSRWYYFYIGQTMNRQRVLSFSFSFLFFLKKHPFLPQLSCPCCTQFGNHCSRVSHMSVSWHLDCLIVTMFWGVSCCVDDFTSEWSLVFMVLLCLLIIKTDLIFFSLIGRG